VLLSLPAAKLAQVWVKAVGLIPELVLGEEEEGYVLAYQGMPEHAKAQMNKRILRLLERAVTERAAPDTKRPGRD